MELYVILVGGEGVKPCLPGKDGLVVWGRASGLGDLGAVPNSAPDSLCDIRQAM